MNLFFRQIVDFGARLSVQQKLTVGGILAVSLVVLGSIAYWSNQPDYALLFGELDQADAGQVIEELKGRGVRYELHNSGTAVFVPRSEVYELRLAMANSGVITDGQQGYELFDKATLGMTTFIQNLNMRRALEGELVRTITSIHQVASARLHLVVPERSPFKETQALPSASVVLKMTAGSSLALSQVDGIASLVAGAVEGLMASDVTVLDTQGRVLSSGGDDADQTALSSTQLEMQRSVEEGLETKGQSLLDEMLGAGNSIVRISADLDFSRTISSREIIDPESATIVSEEKIDEQLGENSTANSSVRNYEMTRTSETHEKSVGSINHISVSVVLNQRPESVIPISGESGAPTETTFRSFSPPELAELTELVRNAVGLDESRGDRITVVQTRFEPSQVPLTEGFGDFEQSERIAMYLRYGLIALALVMAFFLIKRAGRQVTEMASRPSARVGSGPTFPALGSASRFDQTAGGSFGGGNESDSGSIGSAPPAHQEESPDLSLLPPPSSDTNSGDSFAPDPRTSLQPDNPLFGQVRELVHTRPEDAAAVIREWIGDDPMAV